MRPTCRENHDNAAARKSENVVYLLVRLREDKDVAQKLERTSF